MYKNTDKNWKKNALRMEVALMELALSILYELNDEIVENFKEDEDNEETQKILFSIKNTYEYINNRLKLKTWHEEEETETVTEDVKDVQEFHAKKQD